MADKHTHIDLTTLREVERLLASTEAPAGDRLAPTRADPTPNVATPAGEALAQLPRRR